MGNWRIYLIKNNFNGKQISGKQALHAMKAYDEAISLGFKVDQ